MGFFSGNKSKFFRIEVYGFAGVAKELAKARTHQEKYLKKFLQEEALRIVKTAKILVPKRTRRLMISHRVESGSAKTKDFMRVDIIAGGLFIKGRMVNYAAAVHEGSPGQPGRPWLANALKLHAPGYVKRMRKAVKLPGEA